MSDSALSGLSVLDLTEGIAGPYCTKLLATFGAEVIKVERPHAGDWARHRGPFFEGKPGPGRSVLFAYLNTNKRSISVNLDSAFGQQVIRDLARSADVIVESLPPGYLEERGLAPLRLREMSPSLVVTSMPMFERGSRYAGYRMTELNLYAMSGLMSIVGALGKPPLKAGGYQAQYMAGLHACALTLFAAYRARRGSGGAWLETSSIESCAKIFAHTVDYTMAGTRSERPDVRRDRASSVMPCRDGYMTVTLYYHQISALADLLGNPSLATDPRFADRVAVGEHERELRAEVARWLSTRTADEAQREAQARHLLFTKVHTTRDLFESDHLRARGFFRSAKDPEMGETEFPGPPFHLRESPASPPAAAPALGEANELVLCGRLGIPVSDLGRLRAQGVI